MSISTWVGVMGLLVTLQTLITGLVWRAANRLAGLESKIDRLVTEAAENEKETRVRFEEQGKCIASLTEQARGLQMALYEANSDRRVEAERWAGQIEKLQGRINVLTGEIQGVKNVLGVLRGKPMPPVREDGEDA